MRKHSKILAIFVMAALMVGSLPVQTKASSCNDVEVVFARGSGATPNDSTDYMAFKSALSTEFATRATGLSYRFYDLGSSKNGGHQYPAVSIEDGGVLLGAYVGSGSAFKFGKSVNEGRAELKAYIRNISASCPNSRFLLAGYSQGAMVISKTLSELNSNKLLYAATFGDPKLYLPEGKNLGVTGKPLACSGKHLSNYRINVPDCEVESGILGALDPYQASGYANKLGAWCNEADFMCGSYFDMKKLFKGGTYEGRENSMAGLLETHLAYNSDGSYSEAAKIMLNAVATAFPDRATTVNAMAAPSQNVAILLDTTESMNLLIKQYKKEALSVAKKVKDGGGKVAIYVYGDELRDGQEPKLICGYGCSLGQIRAALNAISVSGGGDDPESALSGMLHVMNTMTWEKGANKSIILLTDAGYHKVDIGGITITDVVRRSYEIDPVNIFTITPSDVASEYAELTEQTGGKTFNSASEMSLSTTEILERSYVNIGEVSYETGDEAVIEKVNLEKTGDSSVKITISDRNADGFYLAINEAPLGMMLEKTFSITELPEGGVSISITPINSSGRKGVAYIVDFGDGDVSNSGVEQEIVSEEVVTEEDRKRITVDIIKAPNCGAR